MSIVPSQLQFSSGGKSVAIASSRRTVKVIPEAGSSSYNPDNNNTIRIDLSPSLGFLDCHNSFLSFRIKTMENTVDHTKECRLDKNSMSWVRRLTIHSSTGSVLEDLDHYNLCVNLLHTTTGGVEYANSIGQMVDNTGDRAVRNASMANPKGAQFNSGFDASGILSGEGQYLPLAFMQGPMTIELRLADFKDCFVGTPVTDQTASYEILNVEYHANVLSMSEEYNARFSEQLRSRGIDMSFDTYKTHVTTLTSNDMDIPISQNSASVKGSYHVLRSYEKYNSDKHDSLSTYKSGNLEEVMWDLGGQLYPTQPLKLKDDGVTSMYTHNLQSFNMFRNHSLGCKVDDRNFWSAESSSAPRGSATSTYTALPVRRVYGRWVANSGEAYKTRDIIPAFTNAQLADGANLNAVITALKTTERTTTNRMSYTEEGEGGRTYVITQTVSTLHFVPNNARDIHLIEQGMRCKMGLANLYAAYQNETSEDDSIDITTVAGDDLLLSNLTDLVTDSKPLGLDRFFKPKPTDNPASYADSNSNLIDGRNVMYPGAPCAVAWGGSDVPAAAGNDLFVSGIGIPFVDGNNKPILSRAKAFRGEGWVDIIPSDEQFYIGNSFETFMESPQLVSGSDLTNATPLHLKLKYASLTDTNTPEQFFEHVSNKDVLTSFIHIDSVLRLQPDGTLISSV